MEVVQIIVDKNETYLVPKRELHIMAAINRFIQTNYDTIQIEPTNTKITYTA